MVAKTENQEEERNQFRSFDEKNLLVLFWNGKLKQIRKP